MVAAKAGTVAVKPGYPGLGWREDVKRIDGEVRRLRARQNEVIAQALAAGVTLTEIGRAFGCSRQTAWKRWGHLRQRTVVEPEGGRN